jgi:hypothetical protein
MRLPRARFTVRRMMIAVAVVAVLLGVDQIRRKFQFCRARASLLREQEARYLAVATHAEEAAVESKGRLEKFQKLEASEEGRELAARNPDLFQAMRKTSHATIQFANEARRARDIARRLRANSEMYERAMIRPWESLPVELDSPEEP